MAESRYTAKTLLVEVDNAIQRILVGGQSVKIGSRNLTRADLSLLLKTRNDLNAQIAAEGKAPCFRIPTSPFLTGGKAQWDFWITSSDG